ncbi:Ig-like domain-containing protein [Mycobacterium sp. NBC_00419]|uniref:Ig-like domain-containing protein n=1 Tax=Mycobacterium sp. NBC_00419 TaxID=2975989 RepID=UPI002E1D8A03
MDSVDKGLNRTAAVGEPVPTRSPDPIESELVAAHDQTRSASATASGGAASTGVSARVFNSPPQLTPADPLGGLNAAVTRWFDGTASLLGNLPASPISEFLQGALLLVRRTLFNQTPTVDPINFMIEPNGETVGSLKAVDPEGDALTYSLAQQPTYGTVQITPDGVYTYIPGPDFNGYDSFTATVSDRGFNLLDPFSSRSTEAFVEVPYWSQGGYSRGFTVTNLTGSSITLSKFVYDRANFEGSVGSPPVGTVLKPGDTVRFESTQYLNPASNYQTTATFTSTAPDGTPRKWAVNMYVDSLSVVNPDNSKASCTTGDCTFTRPDGWTQNGNTYLVDPAGSTYTIDSGQGQKQAQILNSLCSNGSAKCSFSPKTFEQTQTKPRVVATAENKGSTTITSTFTRTETSETTTSLTLSLSAKATILQLVELGISRESTQSWTESTQYQFSIQQPIEPNSVGILEARDPIKRVTGDFVATIGNTTYRLNDVTFETPDPDPTRPDGGRPVYTVRTVPLAAAV